MAEQTGAPTDLLTQLEAVISGAAERQGRAVVGIGRGWRSGSGVVVAPNRVLTAAHSAAEGASLAFAGGRRADVEGVSIDRELGLAVITAETGGVEALEWHEDSSTVGIGAPVVALANPAGRGLRATLGFVSAIDRSFRGPSGRSVGGALEHTAPLPRGSAGGPLLDRSGRLVGVNALRLEGGLILALGADSARDAVTRLSLGEEPRRARLGVAVAPPAVARKIRRAVGLPERDGLLVRGVQSGAPAERAGLAEGDLIVAAGGEQVDAVDALHRAVDAAGAGELTLTVVRGADEREVCVDLDAEAA